MVLRQMHLLRNLIEVDGFGIVSVYQDFGIFNTFVQVEFRIHDLHCLLRLITIQAILTLNHRLGIALRHPASSWLDRLETMLLLSPKPAILTFSVGSQFAVRGLMTTFDIIGYMSFM